MSVEEEKKVFLENEAWRLSIQGAFQRAYIYGENVSEGDRKKFRKHLNEKMQEVAGHYKKGTLCDHKDGYIGILREFQKEVKQNTMCKAVLRNESITLGVVQKLVNLYLKYLWCFDQAENPPPHCPFDAVVIKALKARIKVLDKKNQKQPCWTKLQTTEEYQMLVKAAESESQAKEFSSIAEWELRTFNENRN